MWTNQYCAKLRRTIFPSLRFMVHKSYCFFDSLFARWLPWKLQICVSSSLLPTPFLYNFTSIVVCVSVSPFLPSPLTLSMFFSTALVLLYERNQPPTDGRTPDSKHKFKRPTKSRQKKTTNCKSSVTTAFRQCAI